MVRGVAFVFPGQGSQRIGMFDAQAFGPRTQELLDMAEELSGLPLRRTAAEGPADALASTRAAQPLLFVAGLSSAWLLEDAGVVPDFVAGHSLGELTALAYAGVVSAEVGIELVSARARIMDEAARATSGTMAAVLGMPREIVAATLDGASGVCLANDNSDGQAVVSGTHAGVERAMAALSEAGARKVVPLQVAGPFHSPLMRPARDAFAGILAEVPFEAPRMPVLQNTDPTPATDPAAIKARLMDQIVAPVRWRETMAALSAEGVGVVVETGPGAVLAGLARRVEGLVAVSVDADGMDKVREVLGA